MVLAHHLFSQSKLQKMNPPSPSWTIHELRRKHEASGEAAAQFSVVVGSGARHREEGEAHFKEWAKGGVAHRLEISSMITVAVEVAEVVDLAGKTTINHNEIVILRSIFVPTGR